MKRKPGGEAKSDYEYVRQPLMLVYFSKRREMPKEIPLSLSSSFIAFFSITQTESDSLHGRVSLHGRRGVFQVNCRSLNILRSSDESILIAEWNSELRWKRTRAKRIIMRNMLTQLVWLMVVEVYISIVDQVYEEICFFCWAADYQNAAMQGSA